MRVPPVALRGTPSPFVLLAMPPPLRPRLVVPPNVVQVEPFLVWRHGRPYVVHPPPFSVVVLPKVVVRAVTRVAPLKRVVGHLRLRLPFVLPLGPLNRLPMPVGFLRLVPVMLPPPDCRQLKKRFMVGRLVLQLVTALFYWVRP